MTHTPGDGNRAMRVLDFPFQRKFYDLYTYTFFFQVQNRVETNSNTKFLQNAVPKSKQKHLVWMKSKHFILIS